MSSLDVDDLTQRDFRYVEGVLGSGDISELDVVHRCPVHGDVQHGRYMTFGALIAWSRAYQEDHQGCGPLSTRVVDADGKPDG